MKNNTYTQITMKQAFKSNKNNLRAHTARVLKKLIGNEEHVSINEIRYFHPNRRTMPNGSHYTRGGFLHECHLNSNSFSLDEGVNFEQSGLVGRCGMIVFSKDSNIAELDSSPFVNEIETLIETFKQQISDNIKRRTILKHNTTNSVFVGKYSIGNYFHGRYGENYDAKSLCVSINDISSTLLIKLAKMMCKEFRQEILIKDFNTNKIYLAI